MPCRIKHVNMCSHSAELINEPQERCDIRVCRSDMFQLQICKGADMEPTLRGLEKHLLNTGSQDRPAAQLYPSSSAPA